MSKSKKVVVAAPIPLQNVGEINWSACLFCQKTSGQLTNPSKHPIEALRGTGYDSVGNNLELLLPLGYKLDSGFPVHSLQVLGDPEKNENKILTVTESLKRKKAQWHKSCKLKYVAPKFQTTLENAKANAAKVAAMAQNTTSKTAVSTENSSQGGRTGMHTRASLPLVNAKSDVCFLCKEPASYKFPLRHCATDNIYRNVEQCARNLNDTALLAVLAEGDLVAIEAKYHLICLTRLYNKVSRTKCSGEEDREMVLCEGIAFANLLLFIQTKINENPSVTFKMGELVQSYQLRLAQLVGCPLESLTVHTTRMRQKILAHFPMLTAHKAGREYLLMQEGTNFLSFLHREDQDEDALAGHMFLKQIRRGMKESTVKFSGEFKEGCEEACIPSSLLAVVNTLLHGSPVHLQCRATRPVLTICQLIMFNYREGVPKGNIVRNRRDCEPPFPLYMGLDAYGKGRNKLRIEEMHAFGISVSYNRINEVTSQLCRRVVKEAKERNVLCPSNLRHGLFVAAAIDNIDHNPSSTSSKGAGFHGTGISLFQFPTEKDDGVAVNNLVSFTDVERPGDRSVPELPDFYSFVPEIVLPCEKPHCPLVSNDVGHSIISTETTEKHWQRENPWLSHTAECLDGSKDYADGMNASFSAFHALHDKNQHPKALNALLPLFHEKCETPRMVKHAIDIVKSVTTYLNSPQIPVVCGDQPTFALVKTIQWNWPELYGEKALVAVLGPLHIEKAFLRVLGQYCERSGWSTILANSGIVTLGSAEGFLKVSHIMKARAAHQKVAVALFSLLTDAYESSCDVGMLSLQEWAEGRAAKIPVFKFWFKLLNLEILLLSFVKSIREGDFQLYRSSLKDMVPFFFAFNHPQYARWLPVHIRDMETLHEYSPQTFEQFAAGNFVVRKSSRPFSALGLDHAHEQNNAAVKARGGAIGLTEDPSALRRWTIGGPEVRKVLHDFGSCDDEDAENHYEQTPGFQHKFLDHCFALKESFLQFENPFLVDTADLICLDSRCAVSDEAIQNLESLETKGLAAYQSFVQDRLVNKKLSIHDKITQIKWQIFTLPVKKTPDPAFTRMKDNLSLFVRLFIVCQARDFSLDEFFRHENQLCPPSLAEEGALRSGNKALLVPLLEKATEGQTLPRKFDGIVIDGPGLMYELKPTNMKSIPEYFEKVLRRYIYTSVSTYEAQSVAVAWDLYLKESIKMARLKRGEGQRQHDLPSRGGMPKNWESYLKNGENKTELFTFLADRLVESCKDFLLVTNVGDKFHASRPAGSSLPGASCGNKEEADPRIILHIKDMIQNQATDIVVRSNDTDVFILCLSYYHSLRADGLGELWLLFGSGEKKRFIPIHGIANALGPRICEALRGFHAFTGCDGVSFFASKGKRSAWSAWKKEDSELTEAFIALGRPIQLTNTGDVDVDPTVIKALERFTIQLYGADPACQSVNEARKNMFCSGDKPLTSIPPTREALLQHIKRSAYQAGHIWGTADDIDYLPPSPDKYGWVKVQESYEPLWSTLPHIWDACRELDRCGCASDCSTRRCLCRRLMFPCSPACKKCKGECSNKSNRTRSAAEDPLSDEESHQDTS